MDGKCHLYIFISSQWPRELLLHKKNKMLSIPVAKLSAFKLELELIWVLVHDFLAKFDLPLLSNAVMCCCSLQSVQRPQMSSGSGRSRELRNHALGLMSEDVLWRPVFFGLREMPSVMQRQVIDGIRINHVLLLFQLHPVL